MAIVRRSRLGPRKDPIYGVDTDILAVYLDDVNNRPGVKRSGSREKDKGAGSKRVKRSGPFWWERMDLFHER